MAKFYKKKAEEEGEDDQEWEDEDEEGWVEEEVYVDPDIQRLEQVMQEKKIVFAKEWLIDSESEIASITRFYCK